MRRAGNNRRVFLFSEKPVIPSVSIKRIGFVTKSVLTLFQYSYYYRTIQPSWDGEEMLGKKIYLQPMATVLGTIQDIIEMMKGKSTVGDTANGRISTHLTMYGYKWEVRFTVKDIGRNRSSVAVDIVGERLDKRKEIRSVFAFLDSMLLAEAEIEFEENEIRGGL